MKIKNLYTSSHKHATILLQQNCSLKYFIKIKIEFAQCCFRACLLMFQNDWKDFTLVQIVTWESVLAEEIFHNLASLACILKE